MQKAIYKRKIVIVGAGISGLAASKRLIEHGHDTTIIEARSRPGGRIWTEKSLGVPVDLGAAWIHGKSGNPIWQICKQNHIETKPTDYAKSCLIDETGKIASELDKFLFSQRANRTLARLGRLASQLRADISVEEAVSMLISEKRMSKPELQFLNRHLIEFQAMNATELKNQSLFALIKEYSGFRGGDRCFPGGYSQVIERLAKHQDIKYGQIVSSIVQDKHKVILETQNRIYEADFAIVTLPLGVLKSGKIQFSPPLPDSMKFAIDRIPVGSFNKIAMRFEKVFWPANNLIELIPKNPHPVCQILNWFSYSSQAILIACVAAETSRHLEEMDDEHVQSEILELLFKLFGSAAIEPEKSLITRWGKDEFTLGAYSIATPGACAQDFEALAQKHGRIFFAGEATSLDGQGTVHGAYNSGVTAASRIPAQ